MNITQQSLETFYTTLCVFGALLWAGLLVQWIRTRSLPAIARANPSALPPIPLDWACLLLGTCLLMLSFSATGAIAAHLVQQRLESAPASPAPATPPPATQPLASTTSAPATQPAASQPDTQPVSADYLALALPTELFLAMLPAVLIVCGAVCALAWVRCPGELRGFGLGPSAASLSLVATLPALLMALPILALANQSVHELHIWAQPDWRPHLHPSIQELTRRRSDGWTLQTTALFAQAVLLAPLWEEFFFRGLLLQTIRHHTGSGSLAILLSGLLFGLMHAPDQPQFVPALVLLGLWLGMLVHRTGSLWLAVTVHAAFNALSLSMVMLPTLTS